MTDYHSVIPVYWRSIHHPMQGTAESRVEMDTDYQWGYLRKEPKRGPEVSVEQCHGPRLVRGLDRR